MAQASSSSQDYPRPDFIRTKLSWNSLDGPWDFIYDDEDIGLIERWQHNGLPEQVSVNPDAVKSDAEVRELAAFPELKEKSFSGSKDQKTYQKTQIKVPFVFQTPASGLNERGAHEVIWYERRIADIRGKTNADRGSKLLLRFGAVDYEATIWVDGRYVASHRGGHVPFDVDISEAIDAGSSTTPEGLRLTIRVRDSPHDLSQPRGKQYWAPQPESIFYTPSSGIWQSVWQEVVPAVRIGDGSQGTVIRSNDIQNGVLHTKIAIVGGRAGQIYNAEVEASLEGSVVGRILGEVSKEKDFINLELPLRLSSDRQQQLPQSLLQTAPLENDRAWKDGVALWSPEHPTLYDLTLRLYDSAGQVLDEVDTYTGMRSISWANGDETFRLNGKPYFQSLVLDQGYWPETGITPPSQESLKLDVELSKKMGFNGCRKHQKVEDPIFLYWADKLGYLVWGEIANAYEYTEAYVDRFNQEWTETVKRDINHPSVIVWTPVNESWGYTDLKGNAEHRNHIRSLYHLTKSLDPTRPINDNCGWEHVLTDLSTFHDYADGPELEKTCATKEGIFSAKGGGTRPVWLDPIDSANAQDAGSRHTEGAPILCTEFGGVNIAPATKEEGAGRDWGYTTASDPADLLKRIEKLVLGLVHAGHVSGLVYTQLTDIEQEVNGLYSFDRKEKIDASKVKQILDKAQEVYFDHLEKRGIK